MATPGGNRDAGAVVRALLTQTDVAAGGAAVVALLLFLIPLGLPLIVGIPLAIAVYAGVRLLLVRRGGDDDATDAADAQRATLQRALNTAADSRRLALKIDKPAARQAALAICDRCDQILTAIQEDGSLPAVTPFAERLLDPFRAILDDYVKLSARGVTSAQPLLARNETEDFPSLQKAADAFYEGLHRERMVDLGTLSEMLELNLTDLPVPAGAVRAGTTRSREP